MVEIPVCYGGSYGEDLKDVAAHAGLTEEEVIKLPFFCRLQYLYVGIPSWISVSGRTGSEAIYPRVLIIREPRSRKEAWESAENRPVSTRWNLLAAGG